MNKISIDYAEEVREEVIRKQQQDLSNRYARLLTITRNELSTSTRATDLLQLGNLVGALERELDNIEDYLQVSIKENAHKVAYAVVEDNIQFFTKVGLDVRKGFASIPTEAVNKVATGTLYANQWSFSQRIWSYHNSCKSVIHQIVADGIAQNLSTYDIAKLLEMYVDVNAKKQWDWSKVCPGSTKKIDYNAQRMARTYVSHAFQYSYEKSIEKNPYVTGTRWLSALSHGRTCQLCKDRHNKIFKKGELPLDHPNGLCTFVAEIEMSMNDIADDIAKWVNGGSNPALDKLNEENFN